MSKCSVKDSIGKLRVLHEKLCDQEKTWLSVALDERAKVIDDLITLHKMFLAEDFNTGECKKKVEEILCTLNIDVLSHADSDS